MGQGLGKIQKRILEVLKDIDDRYITPDNRPLHWIWISITILLVYHPEQIAHERKDDWDRRYSKNEARRIWESIKGLERRGLIQARVVKVKEAGLTPRFGGTTRWMEIRLQ